MSTLDKTDVIRVEASTVATPAVHRLSISISRRAALASLEHGSVRELFDGDVSLAPLGVDVELVLEIDEARRVTAHLHDPATGHRVAMGVEGRASTIEDDELLHLDAPGLLSATVRRSEPRARPLFLRSPLLASLKLGGGRYETA